ncbi:putative HNHc nuclease [Companilactobacillus metriopterae]|uniref:putative HNHc nuclease n=1 Tax=Companilactobacillus metriopterae TaxID=1909267 RepID=UPI00100B9961|nr:putative HNHc nuclease [Companilactobacillus metriopterae]
MNTFGKLKSIQGNNLKIEIDEELSLDRIRKYSNGKTPTIELNIDDGRKISPDQRKKAYALIGDIADWSGFKFVEEAPQYMKLQYYLETGSVNFSLSNCSVSKANEYITFLIDFCFENDIPFATKTWDMLPNDYAMQLRCLRYRKCCICGNHADVAHFETVGTGRNRKQIDHSNYHFMALCRTHHTEQHKTGIMTFLQKYHIKPIKLDDEDIKKLHIGG